MSRISEFPQRALGNYLERCQKVQLLSNLFRVEFKETLKVYIYSVKSLPQIAHQNGKRLKSIIFSNRLMVERVVGAHVICGRTIFGTRAQAGKQQFKISIEYESLQYQIFLKLVKTITLADVNSPQKQSSAVVFSFLNNMVRNFFHQMEYTEIGRSRKYFDPRSRRELSGANVSVYNGYSSNFCMLQGGLFLKVDPTVKIIQSESALQVINRMYKINSSLSKTEKRMLVEQELVGKTVMANYGRNRCYRIEGISFDTNLETLQFTIKDRTVNILEYYTRTYDIMVLAKKQPLLQAVSNQSKSPENKEIIYLIPQLVLMGGLPEDFDQRKRREVSQTTIVNPGKKLEEIEALFSKMGKIESDHNPKSIAQKLGIKLHTTPTKITGRLLQPPQLQLGQREKVEEFKATNFMLFNKSIYSGECPLKLCVFYPSDFDFGGMSKLMESTCRGLGLKYQLFTNSINFGDYKLALKSMEKCVKGESEGKSSNLCWFIIPPTFKQHYKTLKRMCLKEGVEMNSQATLTTNLLKKNSASIFTKVLLQMAAKTGNKLWLPRVSQKVASAGVLLIGVQCTKDGECKGKSIISYCSNTGKDFSSFYSKYIMDDANSLKTYMKEIIFDCLNEYMLSSQSPPTEVLIIKNGTVKMDLAASINAEVIQTKEILKSVSKSQDPIRLTYVMLDTNSSQKFFLQKGDNLLNPHSGTLVNSQAVGRNFQFYLIAQQCNRGTVKPTYYRVAYSDSTLEGGVIEELLYSQCFNYMNWSGSIKVPSTLQYAKKLGAFVGQYLNRETKLQNLQRKPYYI